MSATLLEGYLRAASQVSRLAVGDPEASPNSTIYKVPRMAAQLAHVEGAPFGTRGGISVVHNFPADGEYTFRMMLHSIPTGQLYGSAVRGEQLEVSLNGHRAALIEINPRMSESDPNGMNLQTPRDRGQGRPAAGVRRLHPAHRRAGRRPARAGRADARRHADRQRHLGRHHGAAPARVRGRSVRRGSPASPKRRAAAASSPAARSRPPRKSAARRRSSPRSRRRPTGVRSPPRTSTAC